MALPGTETDRDRARDSGPARRSRAAFWLMAGVVAMPEPGSRRAGVLASLRPRVGVPRQARGTFAAAVPCLVAVWALSGLYLSLGPSLAAQVTGSRDLLGGCLRGFLLPGGAGAAP